MTTKPTTESNEDGELEELAHTILVSAYKGNNNCFLSGDALDIARFVMEYTKQSNLELLERVREKTFGAGVADIIDTIKAEIEGSAE